MNNIRKWDTETIAFSMVSVDGLDEDEIEHFRGMIELWKAKTTLRILYSLMWSSLRCA